MVEDQSGTRHTVVITGLTDHLAKPKVAEVIARVSRGVPSDTILTRLNSLPWALTRSASPSVAARLSKLLERSGAQVEVIPELPAEAPTVDITTTKAPAAQEEAPPVAGPPRPDELQPVETGTPAEPTRTPPVEPRSGASTPSVDAPLAFAQASEPEQPEASPAPSAVDSERVIGQARWEQSGLIIEPLTLGGILDRTFHLCRRHFWPFLGIIAIPWLATIAVVVAGFAVLGIYGLTRESLGDASTWALIIVAALAVPSVVVALAGLFYLSQGALIHAVSSAYLGRTIRIRAAYNFVFERLGRFLLTSLLFVLVAFLLVAVVPALGTGLYLLSKQATSSGWWSAFTWPFLLLIPAYGITKLLLFDKVVIIEDVAYGRALRRSWRLLSGKAEGSWPRGFFLRLIILLNLFIFINIAISLLFGTPAALIAALFPESLKIVGEVLGQLLKNTGSLVAGLFGSVCMVVFYYDIRNRKEGFDLRMLAGLDINTHAPPKLEHGS